MIDIYATYTKNSDGTINTNRIMLQTVPASDEAGIKIQNPTVKGDIGNAESMDFSIQPGTPYYGALLQMRTYIQVDYDGETIFYGRVLTINEGYFGEQKIHCEGALAFLNDSYFPGKNKSSRPIISINEHMTEVITNHNSQVNEPLKAIQLGEVPGHYTSATSSEQRIDNASREFGQNSWSSSKSVLEDLKSHYGGAFRIRYVNNTSYLDWLDHYYRSTVSTQEIKVGKNLIDLSSATEVSNIFTAIIPIGKSSTGDEPVYITGCRTNIHSGNYLTVPQICKSLNSNSFYTDAQLNSGYHTADDYKNAVTNYGLIFKTVEFQEAHTADDLIVKAAEWIKNNYQGGVTSFTVKALDLHMIGENTGKIMLGDRVKLTFPVGLPSDGDSFETDLVSIVRTCTSASYDLFNPENNQYTFGIPANMLSKTYGENSVKKGRKGTSTGYKGKEPEYETEPEDDTTSWLKKVFNWLEGHKVWYNSNGHVQGGPRAGSKFNYFFLPTENMEDGETIWELWGPFISQIQAGGTIIWQHDSQGRPRGDWNAKKRSEFTYNDLTRYHLFEYVQSEYGIDLRTGLSIKMPSIMPEEDGSLSIFSGIFGTDEGESVVTKIASFLSESFPSLGVDASSVLDIFSSDGINVAKILSDGSFLFVELDDQGNVVIDSETNEPKYVDVRKIRRDTSQLASELQEMGYSVTLLDDTVTLIGQTVGDSTYGLVKDVADLGGTITTISSDVISMGQYMDQSLTDMTTDIINMNNTVEGMQATVTLLNSDVTVIGQKVGDSTSGLVKDVLQLGNTVSVLSSDVTVIGQKVGDSTSGLVKDVLQLGNTVSVLSSDVTIIGQTVGDSTSGLVKAVADQGNTVSVLSSDVVLIGQQIGDEYSGMIKDILDLGESVAVIQNAVIGKASVGSLNALEARVNTLEVDFADIDILKSRIGAISNLEVQCIFSTTAPASATFDSFYGNHFYIRTGNPQIPNRDLMDGLFDIQLIDNGDNTYTLQKTSMSPNSGWVTVGTFSRATSGSIDSLVGDWSGSSGSKLLTIKTSPLTDKTYDVGFGSSSFSYNTNLFVRTSDTASPEPDQDNPKMLNVPVRIVSMAAGSPPSEDTVYTMTLPVNATSIWNAAQQAVTQEQPYASVITDFETRTSGTIIADNVSSTFNLSVERYRPSSSSTEYVQGAKLTLSGSGTIGRIRIPLEYGKRLTTNNMTYTPDTNSYIGFGSVFVDVPDRFTEGQESIRLLPTWDSNQKQKLTISKVTDTSYGDSYTLYVVASADEMTYSETTHKYSTTVRAKAGNTIGSAVERNSMLISSGTEAYDAGRNAIGVSALTWDATASANVSDTNHVVYSTSGKDIETERNYYTALTQGSWSSANKLWVYSRYRTTEPASGGTIIMKTQVDASSLVSNAQSAVKISDTLQWATTPASDISKNQNSVTVSTTGRSPEDTKTINLYSQSETSGLTATFYVTHTDSTDANRIITRSTTCSDSNLKAANIKKGVTIFGVAGSHEVAISDTLTWTTTPAADISKTSNGVTVKTSGNTTEKTKKINLYSQVEKSGLTATFYVTHTDSTDANRIIKRTTTCSDSNLKAANIKKGVTIFGVAGSHEVTISDTLTWTTTPAADISKTSNGVTVKTSGNTTEQTKKINLYSQVEKSGLTATFYVTHTDSTDANRIIKRATTFSDSNLKAANIKKGVTIFGVAGSHEVAISDTLTWTTTPATGISVNQNAVTVKTSGNTTEQTKKINFYSSASTSGLTATFYVTHTNSTAANRIIKRTATCSDSNLVNYNIKKDVQIFGVTGTYDKSPASMEVVGKVSGGTYGFTITAADGSTDYVTCNCDDIIEEWYEMGGEDVAPFIGTSETTEWSGRTRSISQNGTYYILVRKKQYNGNGSTAYGPYVVNNYTPVAIAVDVSSGGGGSSYPNSISLYCSEVSTGSTGVKTVRFTVQYTTSSNPPWTAGRSYTFHY